MGTELMEKNIRAHIVNANDNLVVTSQEKGITIYGNIADFLEKKNSDIDTMSNRIGIYLAKKNGARLTKRYEENSTFFEKYFRNNKVKMAELEAERELQTDIIMAGTQVIIKGGAYIAKKILAGIEEDKIKNSVWSLCVKYAKEITGNEWKEYPGVCAELIHIYGQLYGKTSLDLNLTISDRNKKLYLPSEKYQQENIALILYLLYIQKHSSDCYCGDEDKDKLLLMNIWSIVGVLEFEAKALFEKYEKMSWGNAWEMGRLSAVTQSIYRNLMISIPDINMKKAEEVNIQLLSYVPNGDRQYIAQQSAKMITKATIMTASAIAGVEMGNPILIETAATTATSLFKDLEDTEVIGNCLEECGVDSGSIKNCIENAKLEQKKLQGEV